MEHKHRSFRYIYLLQSDGIGTQFIYISKLLDYVIKNNCKLIVDFRRMGYFLGWGVPCEESELDKVIAFDTDKIIYSLAMIDRILREEADEVLGVRWSQEKFNLPDTNLPFTIEESLMVSEADTEFTSCFLEGKLRLVGEYEKQFHQYQPLVSSCVGIHARLGNGEQYILTELYRVMTKWEHFFSAIDASYPDELLFVCTDTPSFLGACINRYGERVISIDRFIPPENCGPGHNTLSVYNEEKKAEYIEARNQIGPYRVLGEALVEMFLLGICKRLICNHSAFTHYARTCRKVEAIVLE